MRTLISVSAAVVLIAGAAASAQNPGPQNPDVVEWEGYPEDWSGPRLYELIFATEETPREERAARFIQWMRDNDFSRVECELCDSYNLYDKINVDSLDSTSFSARWIGSITAPDDGQYTLRQVRDFSGRDGRMKVVVDGETILDSGSGEEEAFTSKPVTLVGGEAAPIVVELVHEVDPPIGFFSGGAPMALLTWKTAGGAEKIIPSSAFSPPAGSGGGASGLQGEYFRTPNFEDVCLTRVDPALDLVWSLPPVAAVYHAEADECLESCKASLLDPEFLSKAPTDGVDNVFDYNLWRVAYRMRATERQRLVDLLLADASVLEKLSTGAMARLRQAVYMLPGVDHVTLLGEWSLIKPQPRCTAGPFPGWSDGSFQQRNTDFWWLTGLFMQGPYWSQVEQLWDEYLERPNGECNLAIAYATVYATREESYRRDTRHRDRFYEQIQRRLDDDTVAGDVRVTWLLAMAFAAEVMNAEHPLLDPDSEYLQEARLVAESDDYRFWVVQEVAARYAALGWVDRLEQHLQDNEATTEDQLATVARWRSVAQSQLEANQERENLASAQSALAVIAELERRAQQAERLGATREATRYREMLQKTQNEQPNERPSDLEMINNLR